MYKIGDHVVNSKVILAPMAGITSFGYRKFMESFGVEVTYSEMISDMGLIYENKETQSYLSFPKQKSLTGIQLFGSDSKNFAIAAKIAQKSNEFIDFIDVNMACPVPKVTKTGAGSALLKTPKKCGEIIRAIKEATGLPVTAKIRLGWDEKHINFLEVISELENAGVSLIAIHARTTKDLYMGEPRWEYLKNIKSKVNVPIAVSGNIFNFEDAKKALDITGADAVMIARGGVGNPELIREINAFYGGENYSQNRSFLLQAEYCKNLAKLLIEEKGEDKAMRIYRTIAPKFFTSFPNSKNIRKRLSSELTTYKSLEDILQNSDFNYDE